MILRNIFINIIRSQTNMDCKSTYKVPKSQDYFQRWGKKSSESGLFLLDQFNGTCK